MLLKKNKLNLFIVDDDEYMAKILKNDLSNHFGKTLIITTFNSGKTCLENVTKNTDIVILDYFLNNENGLEILQKIKSINPQTEVIMFSNNENIVAAIEAFKRGAKDFVVKDKNSFNKVNRQVRRIAKNTVKSAVKRNGIFKMAAILLTIVALVTIYFIYIY